MSQQYKAILPCPNCNNYFEATLYRSIWGEYPENREMVFNNTINSPICPHCKVRANIENTTLLYHNVKKPFAVWYEPVYDRSIDEEKAEYSRMMGSQSYLAKAPRIKNWEEFKRTILKFETGEIKANPGQISPELDADFNGFLNNFSSKAKKSKNSGCLLFFAFIIIISSLVIIL